MPNISIYCRHYNDGRKMINICNFIIFYNNNGNTINYTCTLYSGSLVTIVNINLPGTICFKFYRPNSRLFIIHPPHLLPRHQLTPPLIPPPPLYPAATAPDDAHDHVPTASRDDDDDEKQQQASTKTDLSYNGNRSVQKSVTPYANKKNTHPLHRLTRTSPPGTSRIPTPIASHSCENRRVANGTLTVAVSTFVRRRSRGSQMSAWAL